MRILFGSLITEGKKLLSNLMMCAFKLLYLLLHGRREDDSVNVGVSDYAAFNKMNLFTCTTLQFLAVFGWAVSILVCDASRYDTFCGTRVDES